MHKPIFIIGNTNAGTTCLHATLLSHPAIGGLPKELHFFGFCHNVFGRINRLFSLWPSFLTCHQNDTKFRGDFTSGPVTPAAARLLLQETFDMRLQLGEAYPGERLIFKEPKFSLRTKWLRELWPDCTIIVMVRNPFAVVEGLQRKLATHTDWYTMLDTPTACAQWLNTYNTILLETHGMDDVIFVRYEDMVQNNPAWWARLLDKLGFSTNGFATPELEQDRNERSMAKLTDWDIQYIAFACHALLERFGYSLEESECQTHQTAVQREKTAVV